MKRVLVACLLAATSLLAACGSSTEDEQLTESKVRLKSGESFDGAQRCGVDMQQCSSGLSCVVVELEGQSSEALCVDEQRICDRLECGRGDCGVLDSYPSRVICMGQAGSPSGDNGSVSSP